MGAPVSLHEHVTVSVATPPDAWPDVAWVWEAFALKLLDRSSQWSNKKMPLSLESTAPGSLRSRLTEANAILREAGNRYGYDLSRWEIRAWEPERIFKDGRLTLIAVDPHGVGHSIQALAAGDDEAGGRTEW